jgi:hypothetical protein
LPGSDDLPEDLKPLARRNAIELTDKRWEYDDSQLVDTLGKDKTMIARTAASDLELAENQVRRNSRD